MCHLQIVVLKKLKIFEHAIRIIRLGCIHSTAIQILLFNLLESKKNIQYPFCVQNIIEHGYHIDRRD